MEVRFDDLTPGGRSFRFRGPVGEFIARGPEEVGAALEAVEARVAEGRWAAGYLAYEAAPGLDRALRVRGREADEPFAAPPLVWFGVFEDREALDALEDLGDAPADAPEDWTPSIERAAYLGVVEEIRERIAAGDVYQVNVTLRLRAPFPGDDRALYRDLCLAQGGAFGSRLELGRHRVLSASPELFFELDGDRLTTRPMKGTAPRGRWPEEDAEQERRLLASPKERAENAMIVDLLRNDLGRISIPGSVEVPAMFTAERYETVWQLTSTITSRVPAGTSVRHVLGALFPSGSVTGAPKIRSMEIITRMEDGPRGVYTGAVGYLAPPGSDGPRAAFNVAIRTVVVDAERRLAEYGVGGGITHDSDAEAEYRECLTKARVLSARRPPFDLLETIAYEPGEGFRRQHRHLRRLAASAAYFGFPWDEEAVRKDLDRAIDEHGVDRPARVRLTLARDGAVACEVADRPIPEAPVRLAVDDRPVDRADALRYHKTTARAPYEAAAARHPGAGDVIVVNDRGEAVETTIANLAVRLDGRWWTPPLDAGCLPGVERAALLDEGALAERPIRIDDLERAEGLAVLNSVRGWREAVLIAAGRPGTPPRTEGTAGQAAGGGSSDPAASGPPGSR